VTVAAPILDATGLAELVSNFHRLHDRHYSVASPGEPVEFLEWRVQAIGRVRSPVPARLVQFENSLPVASKREVYLTQKGDWSTIDAFDANSLPSGSEIPGPAIVSDLLTSNFVPAGGTAVTTDEGGLLIEFH